MLALEDIVLRGQIDLWFEEDGELILVDYKSGREERYELQLRLYALALERYLGRLPDRAVLFYLRSGREVDISLSLNDLKGAKYAVREYLRAHNESLFPLREGDHCHRCRFYQEACPAGKT